MPSQPPRPPAPNWENNMEMKFVTTREECAASIRGVCEGCGGKLEPIETVDNSNNPTFWVGCLKCSCFRGGIDPELYAIARELVEKRHFRPYSHMRESEYEGTEELRDYYLSCQTAGLAGPVRFVAGRVRALIQPAPVRREGHSKLVYDKKTRTIVAVDPHPAPVAPPTTAGPTTGSPSVSMGQVRYIMAVYTGEIHGPDVGPIVDWLRSIGVTVSEVSEDILPDAGKVE
jgi:hypothetical protein